MRQHLSELRSGKKEYRNPLTKRREKSAWQLDFDKYGESDLEFYILEEDVPHSKRREAEKKWVDRYNATNPKYGYNYRQVYLLENVSWQEGIPPNPSEHETEKTLRKK